MQNYNSEYISSPLNNDSTTILTDDAFSSHDTKHSKIIKVLFIQKLLASILNYFAKIHITSDISFLLGVTHLVICGLQLFGIPLVVHDTDFWPKSHLLSQTIRVCCFLWFGPTSELGSLIYAFILLILFVIVLIVIAFRSYLFDSTNHIHSYEALFIHFFFRILMSLLSLHITSAIALQFLCLKNESLPRILAILFIIFAIILLIFYFLLCIHY